MREHASGTPNRPLTQAFCFSRGFCSLGEAGVVTCSKRLSKWTKLNRPALSSADSSFRHGEASVSRAEARTSACRPVQLRGAGAWGRLLWDRSGHAPLGRSGWATSRLRVHDSGSPLASTRARTETVKQGWLASAFPSVCGSRSGRALWPCRRAVLASGMASAPATRVQAAQ